MIMFGCDDVFAPTTCFHIDGLNLGLGSEYFISLSGLRHDRSNYCLNATNARFVQIYNVVFPPLCSFLSRQSIWFPSLPEGMQGAQRMQTQL